MINKRWTLFGFISLLVLPLVNAARFDVPTAINYVLGISEYTTNAMIRFAMWLIIFFLVAYGSGFIFDNKFLIIALSFVVSVMGVRFIPDSLLIAGFSWLSLVLLILILFVPFLIARSWLEYHPFLRKLFLIIVYILIFAGFGWYMGYDFGDSLPEFFLNLIIFFSEFIFYLLGMPLGLTKGMKFALGALLVIIVMAIFWKLSKFFGKDIQTDPMSLKRAQLKEEEKYKRKAEKIQEERDKAKERRGLINGLINGLFGGKEKPESAPSFKRGPRPQRSARDLKIQYNDAKMRLARAGKGKRGNNHLIKKMEFIEKKARKQRIALSGKNSKEMKKYL